MRRSRIKVEGVGVYHCISRIVAGDRLLDDRAKEVLRKMLWKTAAFCGVEVLAYCLMSNHFHVLVRVVPATVDEGVDREEILRRYRAFYGAVPSSPECPTPEILAARFEEGGEAAERWERRLRARMGDVSEFMKTLKQRYTIWFNKTHRRFGTLWSERFKSLLVEDSAFALKTVAAYIDLNPVRAHLAEDPAEYRWCSYAEAMAGNPDASAGLAKVMNGPSDHAGCRTALESYRTVLFGKGTLARRETDGVIATAKARGVQESIGRITLAELLRCRLRFLTDGAILGSQDFVMAVGRMATVARGKTGPTRPMDPSVVLESEETDVGAASTTRLVTWRRARNRDRKLHSLEEGTTVRPRSEH